VVTAGILGNQAVARYKLVVGRRIRLGTLIGDAKHSWLDARCPPPVRRSAFWAGCSAHAGPTQWPASR